MDRKAHAISFARQAYLRQGLDTLYGQSFDDLLLPELDDAWDVGYKRGKYIQYYRPFITFV